MNEEQKLSTAQKIANKVLGTDKVIENKVNEKVEQSFLTVYRGSNNENGTEGLLTSQNFNTDFLEKNAFTEYFDNRELVYRSNYVDGVGKWYDKNYRLGFNKQNYNYLKRIAREYTRYIFKDVNFEWLEEYNVLSEHEANNIIKKVLLYKKLLVRFYKQDNVLKQVVYFGKDLDAKNTPCVIVKDKAFKIDYDEIEETYKHVPMFDKVTSEDLTLIASLNSTFETQPKMDFVFNLNDDQDIIKDCLNVSHIIDIINSNIHYQLSVEPTLISMPESMIKAFKKGVRVYRSYNDNGLIDGEKPLLPESITPQSRIAELREYKRELKDELSEITNINFLADVNGNNSLTATEYSGKQKPFVQLINDFNIIFESQFKVMIDALIEYYNLNTANYDGFYSPPYVVQDLTALIEDLVKLGSNKIPSIQSKMTAMLLGLDKNEEEALKLEIEEVSGLNLIDAGGLE